jgi:N-acetylglucosaminyl-diphospho-decaprenol L-rhamnosyltransferase
MTQAAQQYGSVAVVVVNYRTPDLAIACVRSLAAERASIPGLEVMLVDNASGDGSPDRMRDGLSDLIDSGFMTLLPLPLNGGFGWGNNQALLRLTARPAPPEFVMLLNPDCEIGHGAIQLLLDEMRAHPRCGVAGSQLVNPDGSLSGSAFRFHSIGTEFIRGARISALHRLLGVRPVLIEADRPVDADWVTGAACMFRIDALAEVGLFDDGFFLYFEEVELMHRLQEAGWGARHVPASRVVHIGGAATGVREARAVSAPSVPPFWYQARRRYFARAYGTGTALAAGLAWLAGDWLAAMLGLFLPARREPNAGADRAQFLATGLRATVTDRNPAIVRIGDKVDQPPAWMGFAEK